MYSVEWSISYLRLFMILSFIYVKRSCCEILSTLSLGTNIDNVHKSSGIVEEVRVQPASMEPNSESQTLFGIAKEVGVQLAPMEPNNKSHQTLFVPSDDIQGQSVSGQVVNSS